MPSFDPFGLGKEEQQERSPEPAREASAASKPRRATALPELVLILGGLGLIGARAYHHVGSSNEVPVPVARSAPRPAPKAAAVPAAAPAQAQKPEEAPAAAPAKAEPEPAKPPKEAAKQPAKAEQPKAETKPAAAAPGSPKKAQSTTFSYVNPAASHVTLLGSFLVRSGGKKPMFRAGKGAWECVLYLNPASSYRYRYEVVDKHGRRTVTGWETIEVR